MDTKTVALSLSLLLGAALAPGTMAQGASQAITEQEAQAIAVDAYIYFYPLIPTLPTKVRRRVLIAGIAFVVGAIGLEMVGGILAQSGLRGGWTYFLVSTIEELVEIISVFLFVDTMAMWFAERGTAARFVVSAPATGP